MLAVRLGATGLESDVWLTRDGEAVLDHDGVVRQGLRKRPIARSTGLTCRSTSPPWRPCTPPSGTELDISLDVKDVAAFDRTIAVARAAGDGALERLWLCHHRWEQVAAWRQACPEVRLVDSTFLGHMPEGPEQRAAALARSGIDAVNLHHSEWTGGLTALFHRFGVLCFGWDAQHDRILDDLLDAGVDAVYSDHVDRMVDALRARRRR